MTDNDTQAELPTVSYGSWATALDKFHEAGGAPNQIHPSAFHKGTFSGSTIALLVKAFRTLELVDKNDRPLPGLDALVEPKTRKAAIVELLTNRYGTLIALPLSKASPREFNEWFDGFGMSSEDTRKAKTFFLHAAKANGITVSKFITDQYKTRTPPSGQRKRSKKNPNPDGNGAGTNGRRNGEHSSKGTSRSVALRKSPGLVSVTVSTDLWELDGEDRDFVLFLMDIVKAWERGVSGGIWAKLVDIE